MSVDPWIPYLGASVVFVVGFCLTVFLIPETFPGPERERPDCSADEVAVHRNGQADSKSSFSGCMGNASDQLGDAGRWMKRNGAVLLIISSFFVSQVGKQTIGILLQYTSKNSHWTYAKVIVSSSRKFTKTMNWLMLSSQASILISLRAGVSLVVLATLMPMLSDFFVHSLKADLAVKDKRLTQVSGICLTLGSAVTFLAPSPILLIAGQIIFALGYAFGITARILVTSLVEQKHLGIVYAGISAMTYCGIFVGGPLLASSFSWGMQLGGVWSGLPFLISAGLFMLATVAITIASHRRKG